MKAGRPWLLAACLPLVACFDSGGEPAVGGSSDSGAASGCPQFGGPQWAVTQHCELAFIGEAGTVEQIGCDYVLAGANFACSGTLSVDGTMEHSCSGPEGQRIACAGQLSGDTITTDCDGCIVVLQRQSASYRD